MNCNYHLGLHLCGQGSMAHHLTEVVLLYFIACGLWALWASSALFSFNVRHPDNGRFQFQAGDDIVKGFFSFTAIYVELMWI